MEVAGCGKIDGGFTSCAGLGALGSALPQETQGIASGDDIVVVAGCRTSRMDGVDAARDLDDMHVYVNHTDTNGEW